MTPPNPENDSDFRTFFRRRTPVPITEPGVFDTARTAFEWLVIGPHPVTLDCRAMPGLPARRVPLDELGSLLLNKATSQPLRDAIWAALVARSRTDGGTWTVACVGLALPWLVQVAARLARSALGEAHDIHAAVVTGFLEELTKVDLTRPRILVRLRWSAYRAGSAALRAALHAAAPVGGPSDEYMQALLAQGARASSGFRSSPPPPPSTHPELALQAAVDAGVISAQEATLIGATRFGELSLAEAAHVRGQTYEAAKKTRQRAESRLAAHLRAEATSNASDRPGTTPTRTSPRLPTVTDRDVRAAQIPPRTLAPHAPDSGLGDRGTRRRTPAHPPQPAGHPGSAQEARSCD